MLAKKGVRFPTHKQHSTLLFAPNTSQKDSAFPNLREALRILCSSSTTMLWSKQSWVTNALHRKVLFHDFYILIFFPLRRRSRSNYFRASLVRALVSRDIQASFHWRMTTFPQFEWPASKATSWTFHRFARASNTSLFVRPLLYLLNFLPKALFSYNCALCLYCLALFSKQRNLIVL